MDTPSYSPEPSDCSSQKEEWEAEQAAIGARSTRNPLFLLPQTLWPVDESGQRPRYRFKKDMGALASTRIPMPILQIHQAFDDFGAWVIPAGKVSQSRESFQPHNRGFKLPLDQTDFYKKYVSLAERDFSPPQEIRMGRSYSPLLLSTNLVVRPLLPEVL